MTLEEFVNNPSQEILNTVIQATNEAQAKILQTCKCGGKIKGDFPQCFACAQMQAKRENRLCRCGKFKKVQFENCYDCSQKNRAIPKIPQSQ